MTEEKTHIADTVLLIVFHMQHYLFKAKRQIKIISSNVFHKKKNDRWGYKNLVLRRNKYYIIRNQSESNKTFSESDIVKMLDYLIDNMFVMFSLIFNRQLPICSFIRKRHTLYRSFPGKTKRSQLGPLVSRSSIYMFLH